MLNNKSTPSQVFFNTVLSTLPCSPMYWLKLPLSDFEEPPYMLSIPVGNAGSDTLMRTMLRVTRRSLSHQDIDQGQGLILEIFWLHKNFGESSGPGLDWSSVCNIRKNIESVFMDSRKIRFTENLRELFNFYYHTVIIKP